MNHYKNWHIYKIVDLIFDVVNAVYNIMMVDIIINDNVLQLR